MIEPTRVFALRHGETAWNLEPRLQGQLDVPLNDAGRRQARQLALALAGEGLAAIYSSDLRRACATALPLAEATGLAVLPEAQLRERCFGRFEGFTYAEIEAHFPEQARRWRQRELLFGPDGGETLASFHERSLAVAARLAAAHAGQAIALFTHGGVLDCLYRAAMGIELGAPRTWQLGNASINRLLFTGERFTVVGWSDRAHLDALPA